MNIFVCSKLSLPYINKTIPDWTVSQEHNITVSDKTVPREKPDVIIVMGVGALRAAMISRDRFPGTPLYVYNWDCYKWCWENPRKNEYNYSTYYKVLLPHAREIWVPSDCTARQMKECWGLDGVTIRCSVPYWDYDDVQDKGYALCCLRKIPDPCWDWFERACDELGIPWKMTKHEISYGKYQEAVAHCTFLVSHLNELSTGGLSIMEGYYLGKPCLISDSPWHGGRDYMGHRARYFKHNDYEFFKRGLRYMWDHPIVYTTGHPYIQANFTEQRMINQMLNRIGATQ